MNYLVTQIILCLVVAFLFGLLIGWLLRGIACRKRIAELEASLKSKLDVKTAVSAPVVPAPAPVAAAAAEPTIADDLKKIHGIGPVLEKILNANGVKTFKQISEFTQSDIRSLSAKLGSFKDRIVRDDWVTKARELHQKKYG